jgi:ParB-like chromosome segregation protein Spo0J
MEGEEFAEFVADIKTQGLQQPIVRLKGQILEGCNRYRACLQAGVEPRFIDQDDVDDPVAFVISANIQRRHLTSAQKRELIAKLLQLDPTKSG